MPITRGTSYFKDVHYAYKYYKLLGCSQSDVAYRIEQGEIFLGIPPYNQEKEICYADKYGRYFIQESENKVWLTLDIISYVGHHVEIVFTKEYKEMKGLCEEKYHGTLKFYGNVYNKDDFALWPTQQGCYRFCNRDVESIIFYKHSEEYRKEKERKELTEFLDKLLSELDGEMVSVKFNGLKDYTEFYKLYICSEPCNHKFVLVNPDNERDCPYRFNASEIESYRTRKTYKRNEKNMNLEYMYGVDGYDMEKVLEAYKKAQAKIEEETGCKVEGMIADANGNLINPKELEKEMCNCKVENCVDCEGMEEAKYVVKAAGCNNENTTIKTDIEGRKIVVKIKSTEPKIDVCKEISVPKRYNLDLTKAEIKDGILTIVVPTTEGIVKTVEIG